MRGRTLQLANWQLSFTLENLPRFGVITVLIISANNQIQVIHRSLARKGNHFQRSSHCISRPETKLHNLKVVGTVTFLHHRSDICTSEIAQTASLFSYKYLQRLSAKPESSVHTLPRPLRDGHLNFVRLFSLAKFRHRLRAGHNSLLCLATNQPFRCLPSRQLDQLLPCCWLQHLRLAVASLSTFFPRSTSFRR